MAGVVFRYDRDPKLVIVLERIVSFGSVARAKCGGDWWDGVFGEIW